VSGPADKSYVEASLGVKCGPLALGITVKLDACGNLTPTPDCGIGPFNPCKKHKSVGGEFKDLGKPVSEAFKGEFKCKPEAKIAAVACLGSKI
jgi:hypothetical protein